MELQGLLADAFSRRGYVTSRQLQRALRISRQAVWNRMRSLVDSGVVAIEGIGRGVRYVPGPRIEAPYHAPASTQFWSSLQANCPAIGHIVVRDGPGIRLRRHAYELIFPHASARYWLLDFAAVDAIGPAFARACWVELPWRMAASVQPINAGEKVIQALAQVERRDALRPKSD